ncbi:hypothetical protein JRI60_48040 [Archangium violaceum]|uniref:hypothetical protein n=1 Tax=Archangium violaceum TaxID=83451 RepID=UPI00194EED7D|nr:hypothetical protein [Archangium violaceum]QRN96659.1 hypothetical protein JRI60_48040 [Archangium violaceum]
MSKAVLLAMAVLLTTLGCKPHDSCPNGQVCDGNGNDDGDGGVSDPVWEGGHTWLDVKLYNLTGTFWNDGKHFSGFCAGSELWFIDQTTGHELPGSISCKSDTGGRPLGSWYFSTRLPPGAYRVELYVRSPLTLPAGRIVLIPSLEVSSDMEFRLDIPLHTVSTNLLYNGAPLVDGAYRLRFFDVSSGRLVHDGSSSKSPVTSSILPGTYQVALSSDCTPSLPCGDRVVFPSLLVDKGLALTVELQSHAVSGLVLHNGAPFSGSTCDAPRSTVIFRDTSTRKELSIPVTCTPTGGWLFNGRVYPGTYEVWLDTRGGSRLPEGRTLLLPSFQVTSDLSDLTLDVKTHALSARFHPSGSTTDTSCTEVRPHPSPDQSPIYTFSYLDLEETTTGGKVRLPFTCPSGLGWFVSGRVYPGTYRAVMNARRGSNLPPTPYTVIPSVQIGSDTSLPPQDVTTFFVGGSILSHGEQLGKTCDNRWGGTDVPHSYIDFVDEARGTTETTIIQCDTSWEFGSRLYPGTYKVRLRPQESLHYGTLTLIPSLEVTADHPDMVTDLRPAIRYGNIRYNGEPLIGNNCASTVNLRELSTGSELKLRITCSSTQPAQFSGVVYPGTYEVTVTEGVFRPSQYVVFPRIRIEEGS